MSKLTTKEQKFVEVFAGNGTEAARLAGYSGDDNTLAVTAHQLLRKPKIAAALHARTKQELRPLIAGRQKRQEFWTEVMNDIGTDMRERLKASELLAKSEGDFTQKIEHSGKVSLEELVAGASKDSEAE